jgi:hypothetical protein
MAIAGMKNLSQWIRTLPQKIREKRAALWLNFKKLLFSILKRMKNRFINYVKSQWIAPFAIWKQKKKEALEQIVRSIEILISKIAKGIFAGIREVVLHPFTTLRNLPDYIRRADEAIWKALKKMILNSISRIAKKVKNIFIKIQGIVFYPFRMLRKILKKPFEYLGNKIDRAAIWMRSFLPSKPERRYHMPAKVYFKFSFPAFHWPQRFMENFANILKMPGIQLSFSKSFAKTSKEYLKICELVFDKLEIKVNQGFKALKPAAIPLKWLYRGIALFIDKMRVAAAWAAVLGRDCMLQLRTLTKTLSR